jgi:ubiquinone/menaquinone biosynthesis C-methylase UbiE
MNSSKPHWETVFAEKTDGQKSWFEEYPHTSMELISELRIGKDSSIIDVGGGDSHLVDALLKKGYSNISVLDISEMQLKMPN